MVPDDDDHKNQRDDARLIAASPDLLVACELTLDLLNTFFVDDGPGGLLYNTKVQLQQAIAKAKQ